MIKENLIKVLHEMEEITKLFKLEPKEKYNV
ncbi:unknown [Clostridium sp. CAG:492]|nr:unknown [Clostridium sp. CAG:492]